MRRSSAAIGIAMLALAACGPATATGSAPDPGPLQKAATATADAAIPTAASALGGTMVFAYGVMAKCNLEGGKSAFMVVAHYEGDLRITTIDEADTVLSSALTPGGFRPGPPPVETVLTNGSEHVRVDPYGTQSGTDRRAGRPTVPTGYTITVHSKCVRTSQKQYDRLVRDVGAVSIDTTGW